MDNVTYTLVKNGTWPDTPNLKTTTWGNKTAQYVRLTVFTEAGGRGNWTSAAEINIIGPKETRLGQWSDPIQFPLVPAAAALIPKTGKILMWSAASTDQFHNDGSFSMGLTQTAIYDPASEDAVPTMTVSNTHHDMFCPGSSLNFDGFPVVTGGNSNNRTSIYDINANSWISASNMTSGRGYQSQVTLSDGRIFTIGGGWSGSKTIPKNGEIYDTNTDQWRKLDDCKVDAMLTNDANTNDGQYFRRDNHGWLFAWKNASVFQAGPSKKMNFYSTAGTGSTIPAGTRGTDGDAMNGNPIMYDAVASKILTVGGSPDYEDGKNGVPTMATNNANLLTIKSNTVPGDPSTLIDVQSLPGMNYARAFHNSVILPNGNVFITGGELIPRPFNDTSAVYYPEVWNSTSLTFTTMNNMTVPRNYHSVALLLLDGRVFNTGGGLCEYSSACVGNDHKDAEIFSPPYIFNVDGSLATRPKISALGSTSVATVKLGGSITVSTDSPVTRFSLIRYASVTHSVNTDQRRIPLIPASGSSGNNNYLLDVPNDAGIAIPGFWMLFAVDGRGVPSVAETVKITL